MNNHTSLSKIIKVGIIELKDEINKLAKSSNMEIPYPEVVDE